MEATKEYQTQQEFTKFVENPYFVDTTDQISQVLPSIGVHAVITRPRRWGKTLFLQSIELFCGLPINQQGDIQDKTNQEKPFGVFTTLNVVTKDNLRVDDILYILRNKELKTVIENQFEYFQKAKYPEFDSLYVDQEIDKEQLLENKFKAALNCFSKEEDYGTFCKLSNEQQQKEKIQELISKLQKEKTSAFYCLLKEFGVACRHFQRYPIIFVTFPTSIVKKQSSSEAIIYFTKLMSDAINTLYKNNKKILKQMRKDEILKSEESKFLAFYRENLDLNSQTSSLKYLANILHELYKVQCLVLIDEYDSVLIGAEINGCLPEIVSLIQPMLSSALKTNIDVISSFITGITRVAKADIFSGVNHLEECTLLDTMFEQCFGFSEGQVQELVEKCNLQMPADRQLQFSKLKTMYNQYRIGKGSFFNPFSIYKCVSSSVQSQHPNYKYFWASSGTVNYLADILSRTEDFENEIDNFLNKELVFIPNTHLDFSCLRLGPDQENFVSFEDACSYAFHLGYLTLSQNQDSLTEEEKEKGNKVFKIPNEEIKDQMIKTLLPIFFQKKWEMNNVTFKGIDKFIMRLDRITNFEATVKKSFLNKLVFRESMTESDFQAILSGVFNILKKKYQAFNEQQTSEHKRIDTIYYPIDQTTSVVVLHENKIAKEGNYQQSLDNALWQIFTNRYVENTLPEKTNLPATTHALIRALVFYPNLTISKWEMKAEQFLLSFDEARKLLQTCKEFDDFVKSFEPNKSPSEKEIRYQFLGKKSFSSISQLIKSHSLHDSAKKAFSSEQTRVIRPALMAEFAIPQASFYSVSFLNSLKSTQCTPPLPSQKMAISLLNNFQRAEHRRIQV